MTRTEAELFKHETGREVHRFSNLIRGNKDYWLPILPDGRPDLEYATPNELGKMDDKVNSNNLLNL
jgi:hypothetical protein